MTSAADLGTPRHRQVFLILLDGIRSGRFAVGEAMPTEAALSHMFGVSRVTVRRALQDLALQGLIERKHGLGTFVRADGAHAFRDRKAQFDRHIVLAGALAVEVLECDSVPPPPHVAEALGLAAGEQTQRAVRVRSREGYPVMHLITWVPLRIAGAFSREELESQPLYQLLADAGQAYTCAQQTIGACLAEPKVAGALNVESGAALLLLRRILRRDAVGVEYLELRASPTAYEVSMSSLSSSTISSWCHHTNPTKVIGVATPILALDGVFEHAVAYAEARQDCACRACRNGEAVAA